MNLPKRATALVLLLSLSATSVLADDEDRLPKSVDNPEAACNALDNLDMRLKSRPDESAPIVMALAGTLGAAAVAGGAVALKNILASRAAAREFAAAMSYVSGTITTTVRQALSRARSAGSAELARDAFMSEMTSLARKMPTDGYFKQLNPATVQRELKAVLHSDAFKKTLLEGVEDAAPRGLFSKAGCALPVVEELTTKVVARAQAQFIESAAAPAIKAVINSALKRGGTAFIEGLAKVATRAGVAAGEAVEGAEAGAVMGPIGMAAGAVADVMISGGEASAGTPEEYIQTHPYAILDGGQYARRVKNPDGTCNPKSYAMGNAIIRHQILVINGLLEDTLPPEEPEPVEALVCQPEAPGVSSSQMQPMSIDPDASQKQAEPAPAPGDNARPVKNKSTDSNKEPIS